MIGHSKRLRTIIGSGTVALLNDEEVWRLTMSHGEFDTDKLSAGMTRQQQCISTELVRVLITSATHFSSSASFRMPPLRNDVAQHVSINTETAVRWLRSARTALQRTASAFAVQHCCLSCQRMAIAQNSQERSAMSAPRKPARIRRCAIADQSDPRCSHQPCFDRGSHFIRHKDKLGWRTTFVP